MKHLRVWAGPVASAKTTNALLTARRLVRLGNDLVLIRPRQSVRPHESPGWLVTKGPEGQRLRWPSIELESVHQIPEALEGATVLWLDEPMLFPDEADLYDVVQAVRPTVSVLLSGCPATSELEPFGLSFPKLIAVADDVVWCKADCDYEGRLAVASRSICLTVKDEQVLVGGEETYRPASPAAWTRWRLHGSPHAPSPARAGS